MNVETLTNYEHFIALPVLFMNVGVGVILALLLRWHFRYFGSTVSNREEFSRTFPFIVLTTILIISVVKSSLALSLGLIGALSIIRFRTPIKEPEELAYLFIAIAIGIGLGAEQVLATLVVVPIILLLTALMSRARPGSRKKGIYLSLDWKNSGSDDNTTQLQNANDVIAAHFPEIDLRRMNTYMDSMEATFFIPVADVSRFLSLLKDLQQQFPDIGVTYLDQSQLSVM